ncbi:hypothetical protein [Amycolatopsis sp. FDAARGOS 1241]|uniref:hypothetical protein n=1 Tax=Amycolatopsis sp. FDAARGOS 1241 TaxID=2778070 RepID=UPI00194F03D7|nr:hypothetical protein [Amycolatopsis sp. FDAARGOS 1241]QRP42794.1 hypothetical protein I6J71_25315 [Amycolatopsis sp. FDAARGOS 1241]
MLRIGTARHGGYSRASPSATRASSLTSFSTFSGLLGGTDEGPLHLGAIAAAVIRLA